MSLVFTYFVLDCFNTAVGLYCIWNNVYDSRMVFYNVLFLEKKLFTLHSGVLVIVFVFSESTNVKSIFAMSESPCRFCICQIFYNSGLFVSQFKLPKIKLEFKSWCMLSRHVNMSWEVFVLSLPSSLLYSRSCSVQPLDLTDLKV